MCVAISKKDTLGRLKLKFMFVVWFEKGKTRTAKHLKELIIRTEIIQQRVGRFVLKSRRW